VETEALFFFDFLETQKSGSNEPSPHGKLLLVSFFDFWGAERRRKACSLETGPLSQVASDRKKADGTWGFTSRLGHGRRTKAPVLFELLVAFRTGK